MVIARLGNRPDLDGVRAIAIVAVMGVHAVSRLVPGGLLGVDVFFVVSSFLISTLVLEELTEGDGRYRFREFYWRRAFRLAPALGLWLAVLAWPTALAVGQGDGIATWTAGSLLFVGDVFAAAGQPNGDAYSHVWSLAVEEQFYLVWPAVLVLVWRRWGQRRLGGWLRAAVLAGYLVRVVTAPLVPGNAFLPAGHLAPLAAGAAAAVLLRSPRHRALRGFQNHPAVAVAALVVLLAGFLGYRQLAPVGRPQLQLVVAVAAAVLVLHVCTAQQGLVVRALSWPAVVWVGKRSYGLYLYHRTLTILVPALLPSLTLRTAGPVVLLLALVLAAASYRWVERPTMAWGRQWRARVGG